MKTLRLIVYGLALLLATSCNVFLFGAENPDHLSLTMEITHDADSSFESFRAHITLKNESETDFLVHNRLFALPGGRLYNEITVLIKDSSGNIASRRGDVNYLPPSEITLNRLKPGYSVTNDFVFPGWFSSSKFKLGEPYTIVAVYRNDIDYTENIKGHAVFAWVGTVYSNEETFIILTAGE